MSSRCPRIASSCESEMSSPSACSDSASANHRRRQIPKRRWSDQMDRISAEAYRVDSGDCHESGLGIRRPMIPPDPMLDA